MGKTCGQTCECIDNSQCKFNRAITKVSEETQTERLKWLVNNDFILKPNYEWRAINCPNGFMISQSLVETASNCEWDRLTDCFDYFIING